MANKKNWLFFTIFYIFCLSSGGCAQQPSFLGIQAFETATAVISSQNSTISNKISATSEKPMHVWISPSVPDSLKIALKMPDGMEITGVEKKADLKFGATEIDANNQKIIHWIFALVAPFPTVIDEVEWNDLQGKWRGTSPLVFGDHSILMTQNTEAAFEEFWGPPGINSGVHVVSETGLIDAAWQNLPTFAIVPFEQLEPRWKVLRVEGISPLDRTFDGRNYKLNLPFGWSGSANALKKLDDLNFELPFGNRDQKKLTVLVMTGTTALTRSIAVKMEQKGIDYPAEKIGSWLKDADLTHVSNEVAFSPSCPFPKSQTQSLQFCSNPKYIHLFYDVGVNIVELTGNHILNWDLPAFKYTLQLYKQYNIRYFGGGNNLSEARQPLLVENNGNKLAFIGCNPAGPQIAWATESRAGGASCDYEWMKLQITQLRKEDYLPIATMQYPESYDMKPGINQKKDFNALSDAGAVIVSGSQAHFPQTMAILKNGFIHYGLGNLFFDQMLNPLNLGTSFFNDFEKPIAGVRVEVIDRHVFYNGKYLGVELLTAVLEDYSQPRPMTAQERASFLTTLFKFSGWNIP